ncbi:bifunctional phosphoribosylaminoimidazolecarboxamide formyltransferase/IMP cyclohydrolase [Tindallia californiensis]|uniref:Bifunctional purine biosynthesis protein PurH n=1 Tax=Tindallia californiensis TaxID=159292 RepID=A0A1H3L609_9FIRM|nr:bifunctional phosphoribosylaminoimidazolecarboxamide formyltransferase/IMP cyclohydrolase [Tindallia californiensis]SDY59639.1 IMP cyclohydrolase /phosphoribosylaminoimidazolecarboxamide formyltransferase [Tindallia californiensis]
MIKRALISVSDKTGIKELGQALDHLGVELISTGGTAKMMVENGIKVKEVSEITGFPECLDGRVKTLHPAIHGGLLARREIEEHMQTLEELDIQKIDLVIINLYPFRETMEKEGVSFQEVIEQIDIGGPAMLRSAAKNHQDVTVVVDPEDYETVLAEMKAFGNTKLATRKRLAKKVFQLTSHYDTLIAEYLSKDEPVSFPEIKTMTFEKVQNLRYGENPHQQAAFYREIGSTSGTLPTARQIQGKELSFNNINDAAETLSLLQEFDEPTAVAVKHTNPCGVASAETVELAYQKAFQSDPLSIFGGIVAVNRPLNKETADQMIEIFLEVIIAPSFTPEALEVFASKPNIRLLEIPDIKVDTGTTFDMKKIAGGMLIQESDKALSEAREVPTEKKPTEKEEKDLQFAWKIVKHIKSNAIVIVKDQQTLAVGPGQTSRIWALQNALRNTSHQVKGAVMASDAFFPFPDCVEEADKHGITAIIQPGGSNRDQDSVEACDKAGISMVFTGMRHFKH